MVSGRIVVVMLLGIGFVGCGGPQSGLDPSVGGPAVQPPRHANVSFRNIYNFKGAPDGAIPEAGLTLVAGKFYGTTTGGGNDYNDGTVYDVQEDGTEHVLHGFTHSPDGSEPKAGLTQLNNESLYGTTSLGGKDGSGTVYEIKTDGTERVLHSFKCNLKDCDDGANPDGDLAVLNDKLYGTTQNGGTDKGVVFEVRTDGTERIVYSFTGTPDGDLPHGGLVQWGGSLYGTTERGGTNNLGCVFKVDTDGKESVVYSFRGGNSDGSAPVAGLTVLNGSFYGVTKKGGGANDDGTVFEVRPDGTERVVHAFSGRDGMRPFAGLTKLKGVLYGTTLRGGAHDFGTVFEVQPGGSYGVLHDFAGTDGSGPEGTLTVTAARNALIGTTRRGGTSNKGTVFLVSL